MPKAEVGSTKYLNNRLKSKGLQRLRWYCQVCERQMRDENGFKMHTQSEGHVRQMLLVGENSKKFIADYSSQFQRDFIQLLRTSHGEKRVHLNHFYQEYISNKEHVHMNATRWPSLMEFAKFMGREGIARVDEDEKGIYISWVDNSPENLRRQEAIRKRERQDRGDEERELAAVGEQIRRARKDAERRGDVEEDDDAERELKREEGEKIKLSFGAKPKVDSGLGPVNGDGEKTTSDASPVDPTSTPDKPDKAVVTPTLGPARVSMKMGTNNKPKNVFAAAKKNALGGKKSIAIEQPKKMSEAERIMREEMEKGKGKRGFGGSGGGFGGGPEGKRMRM